MCPCVGQGGETFPHGQAEDIKSHRTFLFSFIVFPEACQGPTSPMTAPHRHRPHTG